MDFIERNDDELDKPKTAESGKSRRDFLASAAALSTASLVTPAMGSQKDKSLMAKKPSRSPATGASVFWEIEAVRIEQSFGEGSIVPFFRFVPINKTPAAGILPKLAANAGQYVTLSIKNTLSFPVQPTIVDYQTGPVVNPGETVEWDFRMPTGGTWLLTESLLGAAAGPVGFGAMLVSERPPVSLVPVSPIQYHHEYTLLYQDADDRWNLAVDAGDPPDLATYEPNFHTLNGLTFPDTLSDPETLIACEHLQLVLLRMGNLGHVRHVIHFHGYHAHLLYKNNQRNFVFPEKDCFPLPGHSTIELLLPVAQPGMFPMHPHTLTSTTDNGVYPFGQITLINAAP